MAWSQEQTEDLIRRWNNDEKRADLAKSYGITVAAIIGKVHRLRAEGVQLRMRNDKYEDARSWKADEEETLKALWPDPAITKAQIGERLRRTANAVSKRARVLGLGDKPKLIRPQPTVWTPERLSKLKELFDRGYSAGLIAQTLGVGASTTHTKLKALGWVRPKGVALIAKTPDHKTPRVRRAPDAAQKARHAELERERRAKRKAALVDVSNAKTLLYRQFGECAFPVAGESVDTLYCCAKVEAIGKPYCAAHAARMYMPGKPIEPRPYAPNRRYAA